MRLVRSYLVSSLPLADQQVNKLAIVHAAHTVSDLPPNRYSPHSLVKTENKRMYSFEMGCGAKPSNRS